MKKIFFVLIAVLIALGFLGCEKNEPETETVPTGTIIPVPTDVTVVGDSIVAPHMQRVAVHSSLTHAQPMTGLVLWPDQAADLDATYRDAISMEFMYCLPCRERYRVA